MAALQLAGCRAAPVQPNLHAADAPAKIPGIMHAAYTQDHASVTELVAALDSDDPAVRLFAYQALVRITGKRFDYVWYHTQPQRQASLNQWRAYRDALASPQATNTPDPLPQEDVN